MGGTSRSKSSFGVWQDGCTGTVDKERDFTPRAFAEFQVREKQHEQIYNLKTSLRLLCGEVIWGEEGVGGSIQAGGGGAWTDTVVLGEEET